MIQQTSNLLLSLLHIIIYPKLFNFYWNNTSIKTKKEGEIPLHFACKKGNFEIVEILLKSRFRDNIINQRKSDNKISLHLASITSSLCT